MLQSAGDAVSLNRTDFLLLFTNYHPQKACQLRRAKKEFLLMRWWTDNFLLYIRSTAEHDNPSMVELRSAKSEISGANIAAAPIEVANRQGWIGVWRAALAEMLDE